MYLIANGGLSMNSLKNTYDSIILTKFLKSADGIMVDVRLSLDGRLVIMESDLVYGKYYISKMNYNSIKKIRLPSKIHRYYIPLLKDVLDHYCKDILIIRLHHAYDNNEVLVNNLISLLKNYSIKKIIITTENNNLYDYLQHNKNYDVYYSNTCNDKICFIYADVRIKNINNQAKYSFTNGDAINRSRDNVYVITNNPFLISKYLL